MFPRPLAWILPLGAALCTAASYGADLEVELRGIHSAEGHALVALHGEAPGADFPSDASVVANAAAPAATDAVVVVFRDLPAGAYAVAAFHDANGDGELNANLVGMPTECYGFSNDARGFMGPPSFDDAAFSLDADAGTRRLVLNLACPESAR
ncbi:MAG: DUF2141 domain-containing protein [Gammaproteobacteria bacterium]|nr:DUF2141 domain-containing protein [Gammaproteobacteria bacterium]